MLYCYDCQKYFPCLRDFRKHERVHRRLQSCQQCNALFSTAEAKRAHTQEKHCVLTGCQTDPERSRQHQQRPKHRPPSRPHSERCCSQYSERRRPQWRPPRDSVRATSVPTVVSVAVKTDESAGAS